MSVPRIWHMLGNKYLLLTLRLIIGFTLIFSAVGKLPNQAEFIGVVQAHGILPEVLADMYGLILPWLELLIGILLVCGIFTRLASGVTLLMVISFLIANGTAVYNKVPSTDPSCGCFRWITVQTGDALIIDIVMMVFVLVLMSHRQKLFCLDNLVCRWFRIDEPLPAGDVQDESRG